MSIKAGLFFFLTFCCIVTPISRIDHYCIIENFKKIEKNKNEIRTTYPKNHEHFKNSKPIKKECNGSMLTMLTGKNCFLLNSIQESIEIEAWLLLIFFIHVYTISLSSINSIVRY